jgi:predicted transcriptional regulator
MEELQKIRAAIAAGIGKTELARRANVARRLLDSVDDPKWNPTLQTLLRLAAAAEELAAERMTKLRDVA